MTDTPDTENRDRAPDVAPAPPTLEPNEKLWLESYLDRLKNAPGGLLKRLVVYGSKARGDAGPGSDVQEEHRDRREAEFVEATYRHLCGLLLPPDEALRACVDHVAATRLSGLADRPAVAVVRWDRKPGTGPAEGVRRPAAPRPGT